MVARDSSAGTRRAAAGVFRLEGDYWTVAYEGTVVRLKSTKGLHYLAQLLRHPGRAFQVGELVAAVEPDARDGRPGADPLEARRGQDAERARKAVTNRIRQGVARIAEAHENLGRHLKNAVRTGSRCTYTPERPTRWKE
jgi:hypothetical protein